MDETKFIMHSRFCLTNSVKCSICNEVIAVDDEEDHIKDHLSSECQQCGKIIEIDHMEAHKTRCHLERLVDCQFCQLKLDSKALESHENLCGSKSVNCEFCQATIIKRGGKVRRDAVAH